MYDKASMERKTARSLKAANATRGKAKPQQRDRKTRDPALAQETILDVARLHFVAQGLAGARMDEIAASSGYSKAMIYHYYGSKEQLYVAVLDAAYRDFIASRREVHVEEAGPVVALEAFIREGARAVRKDPSILSLLSIENLHEAAYLRHSKVLEEIYSPLLRQLQKILKAGEEQGVFRPGIDPLHLYVSLSSLIFHTISNRFTLSVTLAVDVTSSAFLDRQIDDTVDMIIGFCLAAPTQKSGKKYRGFRSRSTTATG